MRSSCQLFERFNSVVNVPSGDDPLLLCVPALLACLFPAGSSQITRESLGCCHSIKGGGDRGDEDQIEKRARAHVENVKP